MVHDSYIYHEIYKPTCSCGQWCTRGNPFRTLSPEYTTKHTCGECEHTCALQTHVVPRGHVVLLAPMTLDPLVLLTSSRPQKVRAARKTNCPRVTAWSIREALGLDGFHDSVRRIATDHGITHACARTARKRLIGPISQRAGRRVSDTEPRHQLTDHLSF